MLRSLFVILVITLFAGIANADPITIQNVRLATSGTLQDAPPRPIPDPATFLLLATGLTGLMFIRRSSKRTAAVKPLASLCFRNFRTRP